MFPKPRSLEEARTMSPTTALHGLEKKCFVHCRALHVSSMCTSPRQISSTNKPFVSAHHNREHDAILRVCGSSSFRRTSDHRGQASRRLGSVSAVSALSRTLGIPIQLFRSVMEKKRRGQERCHCSLSKKVAGKDLAFLLLASVPG